MNGFINEKVDRRLYQLCIVENGGMPPSSWGTDVLPLSVWSVRNKKLELDLPGHADEVFAVDWSPDGMRVGSGGKDKVLKL